MNDSGIYFTLITCQLGLSILRRSSSCCGSACVWKSCTATRRIYIYMLLVHKQQYVYAISYYAISFICYTISMIYLCNCLFVFRPYNNCFKMIYIYIYTYIYIYILNPAKNNLWTPTTRLVLQIPPRKRELSISILLGLLHAVLLLFLDCKTLNLTGTAPWICEVQQPFQNRITEADATLW